MFVLGRDQSSGIAADAAGEVEGLHRVVGVPMQAGPDVPFPNRSDIAKLGRVLLGELQSKSLVAKLGRGRAIGSGVLLFSLFAVDVADDPRHAGATLLPAGFAAGSLDPIEGCLDQLLCLEERDALLRPFPDQAG